MQFTLSLASLLSLALASPVQHKHHPVAVKRAAEYVTVTHVQWVTMTHHHTATASSSTTAAAVITSSAAAEVLKAATVTTKASSTLQTSTTKAAAATSTASSSSSSSKRGLDWASSSPSSYASFFTGSSVLSWYYNWGISATSSLASSSLTFVPQIWGASDAKSLSTSLSGKSGLTVLGFNEPDNSGQADLTAAEAAAYYLQYITPLKTSGVISKLGSPAVTNGGGTAGLYWLTEFMTACADCKIDFIALHWYGSSLSDFESHLSTAYSNYGLPIWVTEFACTNWAASSNPSASDVSTFFKSAISYLDSTSWIERYAWFGPFPITDTSLGSANELVTSDGTGLTTLGSSYIV